MPFCVAFGEALGSGHATPPFRPRVRVVDHVPYPLALGFQHPCGAEAVGGHDEPLVAVRGAAVAELGGGGLDDLGEADDRARVLEGYLAAVDLLEEADRLID